ncbi:hypothetical protein FACS1894182_08480 [Bacteroidia bacterium]|nr:hypothetical protein FACS1894182_08480 [Bacteroidia bacterium]
MKQKITYTLEHTYLMDDIYDNSKFMGIFDSTSAANEAIDKAIKQPGFRDHPRECFIITEYTVDDFSKWMDGFAETRLRLLY